jgi:hypothetical protein
MVTSLIADAVVPIWDRALLHALHDAVVDALRGDPIAYIVVMNDSEGPYRQIVAHGPIEYRKLTDRFGALGFAFTFKEGQIAIARPTVRSMLADGNLQW